MRRHYKWPEPINNMRKMQFAFADFFSEKRHGRLFQSFLKLASQKECTIEEGH
jgi:hypothetical protein